MVGWMRPNRWLVEPDSTARFTQRALVMRKETAKALLRKNKNELPPARTLYVSLDRADNVIEGGPGFAVEFRVPCSSVLWKGGAFDVSPFRGRRSVNRAGGAPFDAVLIFRVAASSWFAKGRGFGFLGF